MLLVFFSSSPGDECQISREFFSFFLFIYSFFWSFTGYNGHQYQQQFVIDTPKKKNIRPKISGDRSRTGLEKRKKNDLCWIEICFLKKNPFFSIVNDPYFFLLWCLVYIYSGSGYWPGQVFFIFLVCSPEGFCTILLLLFSDSIITNI